MFRSATFWRVQCDTCISEPAVDFELDQNDAVETAGNLGWWHGERSEKDLCPECWDDAGRPDE